MILGSKLLALSHPLLHVARTLQAVSALRLFALLSCFFIAACTPLAARLGPNPKIL
jgi:hypothetical protein